MKKILTPFLFALTFLPVIGIAQCSTDIIAPTLAISNCTGPQLSATVVGTGPFMFNWSSSAPSTLSSSTSATPTISSSGPGPVTVTLVTVDGGGCTSFDTVTIMFYTPTDTFDYYFCSYPDTICPLPLAMLGSPSWTFVDSSGGTTALPNLPGGCVEIIQMGVYKMFGVYVTACTVNHTYMVYDTCAAPPGICSVDLGPDILAISNCNGPTLESTASGTGAISYAWTGSTNVSFNTPTASTTMISASGPGVEVVTLTITDSTGCVASDNMNITFYHPTDTFYFSFPCLPDTICTLDIATIGSISWSYIDSTGGSTPAGNTSCIAATQQGTYQLFTIYETNCTVIHKYIVSDSCGTGIYEHAEMIKADLYPNPANDYVTILTNEQIKHIIIYNALGEVVNTRTNFPVGLKYSMPVLNLNNGSYLVRVETEKGFVNKRLVK